MAQRLSSSNITSLTPSAQADGAPPTYSSRKFKRQVTAARRIAKGDVVVHITNCGIPAYALMSVERYMEITRRNLSTENLLSTPDAEDIECSRSNERP